LNREGGERRLNVAVSRARKRLEVFCSFLPEQLELAETASEGAKLLRKYLQFARHPELQNNAVQTGQKPEDPLCLDVKSALEKQGFQVHTGIGSSDYRLDLAVVHPENPKRYILGLECDGTAYRNAETATERERLRPSVLNAHGWQIYRIWSMDWHNRKTQIIEEVTGLINELCRQQTPVESLDFNRPAQDKLTENNEEPEMRENDAAAPKPDSPDLTAGTTTGTRLPVFHDYVFAEPRKQPEGADNIWKNPEKTAADLWHVIDHQAPIHEEELFRIVAGYWDCKRLTPKLRNFLSEILDRLNRSAGKTEIERRHNYVYCCDREILPRLYPPEKGIRDISSFAPEELQQIIDYIAQQAGACTKEEMISTVAKELGYKRSGPEIQRRVEELYSP
jgi:very-short-patch-repair endonuclease